MLIKPKAGQPAKIKVVGVGGGGGNAVTSMFSEEGIAGVEFIALNTDAQALLNHKADVKIQIGEKLTKGLGSGGDPEIGLKASEESKEKIKEHLIGADMVFITCGQGGGTGTGGAPIIAQISKETGALTVAVVTKPFDFEGPRRRLVAEEGIQKLKEQVDTLIVVPNQKLFEIVDNKITILQAFKKIDSILDHAVRGIAELITTPGLINVDFADIKSIMANAGTALMGIGTGSGEKRALMAIKEAISSPLLDMTIDGAKSVLFNIVGGQDLTMYEVNEAASVIAKSVDPDADIIFGAVIDDKMMDQVRLTLIATKFDEGRLRLFKLKNKVEKKIQPLVEKTKNKEKQRKETLDEELLEEENEFDIPTFLRKK
jgi:cell division protein FtsZ